MSAVAFAPDGQTLASGNNGWQRSNSGTWLTAPACRPSPDIPWVVNSVAFAPDGQTLASGE